MNETCEHETFAKVKAYREIYGCPFCRIAELEQQLAESRICEICKDKAVLVADKYREQNAKLVEALEPFVKAIGNYNIINQDDENRVDIYWPKGRKSVQPVTHVYISTFNKAAAALKEMEAKDGE